MRALHVARTKQEKVKTTTFFPHAPPPMHRRSLSLSLSLSRSLSPFLHQRAAHVNRDRLAARRVDDELVRAVHSQVEAFVLVMMF